MAKKEDVIKALRTVFDPEIPVNVWDLGLIYKLTVSDKETVFIQFTMTSPACPFADILKADIEERIKKVKGVKKVEMTLTFNPPWDQSKMTPEGKAQMEIGL
ncbi:MAG: metal-sulfur cluster assembly factor [Candidatus Micrarchaeota archaeon]